MKSLVNFYFTITYNALTQIPIHPLYSFKLEYTIQLDLLCNYVVVTPFIPYLAQPFHMY